jgi:two-component system nitrate/nitrite response regulator NarL
MSGATTNQGGTTVAILAQSFILKAGLERILAEGGFTVLGSSQTLAAAQPRLVIVEKPASLTESIETIAQAKATCPETRVVVLGDSFEIDDIWSGRDAGVDGFCLTSVAPAVLVKSLELVMLGGLAVPSSLVQGMMEIAKLEQARPSPSPMASISPLPPSFKLSPREADILRSLKNGAPNKVIARQFDVAEATVKVHVKAILRKLGAANRTQAAIWANDHLQAEVLVSSASGHKEPSFQ